LKKGNKATDNCRSLMIKFNFSQENSLSTRLNIILPGGEYLLLRATRLLSRRCVVPCDLDWCTLSSILPSIVCSLFVMEKLEYLLSLQDE